MNMSKTKPKNRSKWRNFLADQTVPSRANRAVILDGSMQTHQKILLDNAMRSRAIRQRNKANKGG